MQDDVTLSPAVNTPARDVRLVAGPPRARRSGALRRRGTKLLLLATLVALTAWNATRSTALESARNAYARHDYPLAVRLALDHLERRPWSVDGTLLAARGLSEMGRADLAEPYYQRARRRGALSLDDLHARAAGWTKTVELPKAVAAYEEILRVAPEDRNALRILATLHYSVKQYVKARPYAEHLSRLPGGERIGFALLGSIAHDDSNPNAAVAAYQKVLELDPSLSALPFPATVFWRELSEDLIATGRPAEARERLLGALARHDDAELHYLQGKAEEALGLNDEADASCRRAVERDPELGGAWLLLARLALRRQQPREALDELNRAAGLLPETYDSVYTLSQAYRQLGKTEEAKRLGKKAEALRAKAFPSAGGMGAP